MEPLKRIVEFAHSQGQNVGIQLGHAGRKASTVAPWLSPGDTATKEVSRCSTFVVMEAAVLMLEKLNGWPDNVYAPSAIRYNEKLPQPKEMSKDDIENFKKAFIASVKRTVACGFDTVEIHNAQ